MLPRVMFWILVYTKNISVMKYLTDFRKTVETGMDPRPPMVNYYLWLGYLLYTTGDYRT